MAKGMAVPLSVNKGGGAKVLPTSTQLDKLVVLALQEGDDDNPFQDLGLSPKIIYRINDEAAKFDVKDEINNVLRSFKGRLKVGGDGIRISTNETELQTQEGELHVSFDYINLDENEAREFSAPFIELGDRS